MKHVLVFSEYGTINGGENSCLAVLPHLQKAGWKFTFALPCPCEFAKRLDALDIKLFGLVLFRDSKRLSLEEIRKGLQAIIMKVSPDIVHANSLNMSRMLGGSAKVFPDVRTIGHFRDIMKLNKTAIADLNQLDKMIAVSQATADFHIRNGVDASRCEVIHNGVDLEKFQPRPKTFELHRKLGIPEDAKIVLAVGQIGLRKAWDVLLEAIRKISIQQLRLHFVIAGVRHSAKQESLEFETRLLRIAKQKPLQGRVHFPGFLSEMHRVMNDADILVHCARQEPLGRVLLEAAASGLPVVATKVGGTEEIFSGELQANGGAVLIEKDNSSRLASAIEKLADNSVDQLRMSKILRKLALAKFDRSMAANRMDQAYRHTLSL